VFSFCAKALKQAKCCPLIIYNFLPMRQPLLLSLILLVGLSTQIAAQTLDLSQFEAISPRAIGPAGMSGRVTSIDVVLDDPDHIIVGTASGGVWESTSGGTSWNPIFDDQNTQAIGAVAIDQSNPDVIWVGTGEGNPRNSHNSGNGIYRSLDGGVTWEHLGLEDTKQIHRIIVHRDDPNTVYVGALGPAWGPGEDRGIYRTRDGGEKWEKVLYVNDETGCADLVVDPTNPNKLVAAMWEFGRKPWTFNSGGEGSGLYISFDGGDTWQERTDEDGLPKGNLGRMGLAIAPSRPNVIYALVEAKTNGLYRSNDGGKTWKLVADKNIGNRPFYYADIFVDPVNENRIYNLHSYVTLSEDGGKTFEPLLPFEWYSGVHPDHHAFWVHPEDPNYLIEGNDGGLYISRDRGENWRFAENLPVGQFYHVNYDMSIPYRVGGGMQDNGTWVGPAYAWHAGGIKNSNWQEVYFGDGFDLVFQPDNDRYVYAMSQGGNVARIDMETGATRSIRPVHPEGATLRFNWNAALAQDPFDPCTIYYGSQYVHKSTDCGTSWTIISPDLTTNDSLKQLQHLSGGLTIDDTEAENFTTLLAIAPSPLERDVIWASSDDGLLHITRDGGATWTELSDRLYNFNEGSWIPQIEVSKVNPGEAFIVVNDYRRNDYRPWVYHTTDYGESFDRIVDAYDAEGFVLSIVQDPEAPDHLWMGTDQGLYFTLNGGTKWQKWTHDFPATQVADLKIHPRENDLIIGTFGRSIYIMDDIRPFRTLAREGTDLLDNELVVFPAPDAYLAEYKSVEGGRFIAEGVFDGENRRRGAMITLWNGVEVEDKVEDEDEVEVEKKGKGKQDKKIKVQVLNEAGDTIRTFSFEPKEGMNRIYWNLRQDGIRFPSRRQPKPDADPPSGWEVMPGNYTLVFSKGETSDTTQVTVHADPRMEYDREAKEELWEAAQPYLSLVETATEGFDRLVEAQKTIKLVNSQLVNAPDSTQTEIKKMGKALQDSIQTIMKLYMQPEGLKGIQRNPDNINGYLYRTGSYIQQSEGGQLSQSAQYTLQVAQEKVTEALELINTFFAQDWPRYQEKVEANRASLFKTYEPLKME
jgi:photosystem II stability/assembly factor-like uncharacterized protein